MTYRTGDSPNLEQHDIEEEHKKVSNRASGHDGWAIKCSCGWRRTGWRWLVEEMFEEHATPTPESTERIALYWDDESYKRYQSMP